MIMYTVHWKLNEQNEHLTYVVELLAYIVLFYVNLSTILIYFLLKFKL